MMDSGTGFTVISNAPNFSFNTVSGTVQPSIYQNQPHVYLQNQFQVSGNMLAQSLPGSHQHLYAALQGASAQFMTVGSGADDEDVLIRELRRGTEQGRTHKYVLNSLNGVNNHAASAWKDYYLDHVQRIDRLVFQLKPESTDNRATHSANSAQEDDKIMAQSRAERIDKVLARYYRKQVPTQKVPGRDATKPPEIVEILQPSTSKAVVSAPPIIPPPRPRLSGPRAALRSFNETATDKEKQREDQSVSDTSAHDISETGGEEPLRTSSKRFYLNGLKMGLANKPYTEGDKRALAKFIAKYKGGPIDWKLSEKISPHRTIKSWRWYYWANKAEIDGFFLRPSEEPQNDEQEEHESSSLENSNNDSGESETEHNAGIRRTTTYPNGLTMGMPGHHYTEGDKMALARHVAKYKGQDIDWSDLVKINPHRTIVAWKCYYKDHRDAIDALVDW